MQASGSAEEGVPPAEAALVAELAGMRIRALNARAEELGVPAHKLDEAEDAADTRGALVSLIVEQMKEQEAARLAQLQAELGTMRIRALTKRAEELGVDGALLDAAEDAADTKAATIALILRAEGRFAAAAAGGSTQERMNELRKQLTRLKATTPRTVAAAAAATTRPRSRPPTPQRAARPRAVAPAQRAPSIPAPGQPPAQTVAAAAPAPTSSAAPPTRRNKKKSISFLRHDEAGPAVEFTDLQLTPRGGARNAHVSSLLLAPSPRSGPKPGDAPVRVPLLPAFCFSPADR
eukprot:COSAG02_NODE_10713_length_1875_cov_3.453266_2_plen_292_part_00